MGAKEGRDRVAGRREVGGGKAGSGTAGSGKAGSGKAGRREGGKAGNEKGNGGGEGCKAVEKGPYRTRTDSFVGSEIILNSMKSSFCTPE